MKKTLLLSICCLFLLNAFGQQMTHGMIFRVNSPAPVAADLQYGYTLDFGPTAINTITGDLAWIDDGIDSLGCSPAINNLTGKIAMIRRGSCNLSLKIYHAQQAGAIGCVVINNNPAAPIELTNMAGGDSMTAVVIPAVFLGFGDGETLTNQVDAGTSVNASFYVPSIFDGVLSYAFETPQSQITDLAGMNIRIYNSTPSTASNVDIDLDIYDPGGGVTSLQETILTLPGLNDTIVTFASSYTPSLVGTYTAVFKSSLSPSDSAVRTFKINTDNLFSLDNNDLVSARGIGPDDIIFASGGYVYDMGAVYTLPNDVSTDSVMATFALANAADYIGEAFTISLYESPAGGFLGDEVDYTFTILAGSQAIITAADTLIQHSLITRKLLDIATGNDFQFLTGGRQYMLVIQHTGSGSIIQAPQYSYTHVEDFLNIGATVFITELYMGGWTPSYAPVIRLNYGSTPVTVSTGGITDITESGGIEIYPNPSNGAFSVNVNGITTAELSMDVIDMTGRVIDTKTFDNVQGQLTTSFEINVQEGAYLLRISANGETATQGFVVSKK